MPAGIFENDSMFSVRERPWHGLGVILPEPPTSVDEAIEQSGLGWGVGQGSVFVTPDVVKTDPFERLRLADQLAAQYEGGGLEAMSSALLEEYLALQRDTPTPRLIHAKDFRGNIREDTQDVLGIVSDDYKIVPNRDAFAFLDALIGSEVQWETAGSLLNGRRVWVLVRLPEYVEIAGDMTATYIYVANSHDGSMAVTAAATKTRIVCQNTLGWALRESETGRYANRTYKFRHTGDLKVKYEEARRVIGMTINYDKRFKEMGDRLGTVRMSAPQFQGVLVNLIPIDRDTMGKKAIQNRLDNRAKIMQIFRGELPGFEATVGNAPGTAWCGANAIAEFADFHRRQTKNTDQVARSFEDTTLKQKGFDLVREAVGV